MSTPNPLIPQNSNLEQAARSKSTLSIGTFIVGAHAAVLIGLLLIGCNKETPATDPSANTNSTDTAVQSGVVGGDTGSLAASPTNAVDPYAQPISYPGGAPTNAPGYGAPGLAAQPPVQGDPYAQQPQAAVTPVTTELQSAGSEYAVKSGDIAYNIAKKNGVSLKALKDANPGVDLAKLKIGQTIIVPGAAPAPTTSATAEAAASDTVTSYTVKGGDTLTKIAKRFGTTPKAIRKTSGLSSDLIKVGQKLKVPTKAAPAPVSEPASATAPAYNPPAYNPPAYSQPASAPAAPL